MFYGASDKGVALADVRPPVGCRALVAQSRLDGIRHQPDWDWIARHQGWWELMYTVGNSGFAYIVLVQDAARVLPELLALCRAAREDDT
jgi:hypothetical protein